MSKYKDLKGVVYMDNNNINKESEAEISTNNNDKVTVKINDENVIISLNELNKMSKSKIEDTFKISKDELDKLLEQQNLYYKEIKIGKGKTKKWSKTKYEIEEIEAKVDTKETKIDKKVAIGLSINIELKEALKECSSILNITETQFLEEAISAYIASNIAEIEKKKKEQDKKRNSIISKYK